MRKELNDIYFCLKLTENELNIVELALEQIKTKGKLTIEDVRRQIGEVIPGIFGAVSEVYDKSLKDTYKDMKNGKINSDIMPKVITQIHKTYRL